MYAGSSTSLLNLAGGPEAAEPTGKARAITEPSSGSQPKPTAILRETARQTLQVEPPDQGSEPRSPMAPKGACVVCGSAPDLASESMRVIEGQVRGAATDDAALVEPVHCDFP